MTYSLQKEFDFTGFPEPNNRLDRPQFQKDLSFKQSQYIDIIDPKLSIKNFKIPSLEYQMVEYKVLYQMQRSQERDLNMQKLSFNQSRYIDIPPYKHSMIQLQNGNLFSGNYVHSVFENRQNSYLAMQCPIKQTFEDFWQVLYEHKIDLIIMLTKLNEKDITKCDQYWPNLNQTINYEHINVTLLEEEYNIQQQIMKRTFMVRKQGEIENQFKIEQIHWENWPDFQGTQVQDYYIVENLAHNLIQRVIQNKQTVIHCSAGVGRTGTLIAAANLMMTLQYYKQNNQLEDRYISIFDQVRKLRECRVVLVQKLEQYNMLYQFLDYYMQKNIFKNHQNNNDQNIKNIQVNSIIQEL